mmetsp:Transcript_36348/g.113334  ORF Transcript_36348/g.113334 Transcript_36348/m.113334 type:complete len:82 (-) Transcript_36348:114-359(-)
MAAGRWEIGPILRSPPRIASRLGACEEKALEERTRRLLSMGLAIRAARFMLFWFQDFVLEDSTRFESTKRLKWRMRSAARG